VGDQTSQGGRSLPPRSPFPSSSPYSFSLLLPGVPPLLAGVRDLTLENFWKLQMFVGACVLAHFIHVIKHCGILGFLLDRYFRISGKCRAGLSPSPSLLIRVLVQVLKNFGYILKKVCMENPAFCYTLG
jgi:hypothetical protein